MIYQICNGTVKYAADTILENIDFEIKNTEKIAVIGRNGCGKSTLLKLISGMLTLDKRDSDEDSYIAMDGHPSIGYLKQLSFEDMNLSVRDELLKVFESLLKLQDQLNSLALQMESSMNDRLLKEYSDLQIKFEAMGGYSYQQELETIFTKFGFSISDLDRALQSFSGGQQTKIAFVKLLLSKPDIMLLDEPTNHLDMPTIEWLEMYLKNYDKAVVIVSHDRMFLDKIVDVVYEIEYKGMKRYPGNYSSFVQRKRIDYDKQTKDYLAQQKEIERLTKLVDHFKNKPTKVAMTRSKLKQIEHMDKIEAPVKSDLKSFHASLEPRLEGGKDVLNVNHLLIGYDKVLSEVSFEIKKGQKIAVIGENGIGKSTLLKTLVGRIEALGGTYSYGFQIEPGYFDQQLTEYDSDKMVLDDFWDEYPDLTQTEVRTTLGSFLFTKDDVFKKVSMLSGGEKVRLCLAKLFRKKSNFLILDEPTNHLDIIGKETLEAMLKGYTGTVLCVSHDRYFIKEFANALLIFEQNAVRFYPISYDVYLMERQLDPSKLQPGLPSKSNIKIPLSNPGKEAAKREQRLLKLEQLIADCEKRIDNLRLQITDPDIACDFTRLCELGELITLETNKLEQLMEEWTAFLSQP